MVAGAGLAAGALLTAPAVGATECSVTTEVKPIPNVVITTTGRAVVQVDVRVVQPCLQPNPSGYGYTGLDVTAVNPGKDSTSAYMQRVSGDDRDGVWTGQLSFSRTSNVGRWYVNVTVTSNPGYYPYTPTQTRNVRVRSFLLRRDTKVTELAAPRPVRRGGALRLTGHVAQLSVGLKWLDWRQKTVKIYFRPAGSDTLRLVTKTSTNRTGRYHAVVAAQRTGRWFAKVAGTSEYTVKWTTGVRVRAVR
jgi:hypothetical protein